MQLHDEFFDTKFTQLFSYFKYEHLKEQVKALNICIQDCQTTTDTHRRIDEVLTYLNQGGDLRYLKDYQNIPTPLCREKGFIKQLTQKRANGEISASDIEKLVSNWKQAKANSQLTQPILSSFFSTEAAKPVKEETSQADCVI